MLVKLEDVCNKATSNIMQKNIADHKGAYKIFGATGYIGAVDFYDQEESYVAIVKDGAGIGRTFLLPEKTSVINTMQYLLPKGNIIPEYLYYVVQFMHLEKYFTGSTIPHIYYRDYKNEIFNLVPIDQQIQIVKKLDKINELIDNKEKQMKKIDMIVKSRFIEMFGDPISNPQGWPVKRLEELSLLITNGNTPKGGSKNYVNKGILFLRSQNVWKNRIDLEDVAYIDLNTHANMSKSSVHDKDILITKTGRINTENSSLGRAALFRGADNGANINGHVYLVRLDDTVVPEYVVAILTGEAYRKYIRKVCVGGIDKRQINLDQVENFPIILPPKEKQKQFAIFATQIDKSKFECPISLNLLKLYDIC